MEGGGGEVEGVTAVESGPAPVQLEGLFVCLLFNMH